MFQLCRSNTVEAVRGGDYVRERVDRFHGVEGDVDPVLGEGGDTPGDGVQDPIGEEAVVLGGEEGGFMLEGVICF